MENFTALFQHFIVEYTNAISEGQAEGVTARNRNTIVVVRDK